MKKPTYDELMDALSVADHKQLRMKYAQLKQRANELEAQVELIKLAIGVIKELPYNPSIKDEYLAWENLNTLISATPAQCLAEVKAQAGRDGFVAGALSMDAHGMANIVEHEADEYANQIRLQAKAGE